MGYRIVDLFCGCGGSSKGFALAGFDIAAGFDNWEIALENYNANFEDHQAYTLDLSYVYGSIDRINAFAPLDGIIGSPPCQEFSHAGNKIEGERANLTVSYAEIIRGVRPRFFMMENVANAKNSKSFDKARRILEESGYDMSIQVVDASRCGCPQKRKRLIVVGFLDADATKFAELLESRLSDTQMTMRDYFGNSLGTEFIYQHPRSYKRRAVFSLDEPFPTVRGQSRPISPGYPGHHLDAGPIELARPLTSKERARVQTFEDYNWTGTKTQVNQMIGNAVPVNMARFVGETISSFLGDN